MQEETNSFNNNILNNTEKVKLRKLCVKKFWSPTQETVY